MNWPGEAHTSGSRNRMKVYDVFLNVEKRSMQFTELSKNFRIIYRYTYNVYIHAQKTPFEAKGILLIWLSKLFPLAPRGKCIAGKLFI